MVCMRVFFFSLHGLVALELGLLAAAAVGWIPNVVLQFFWYTGNSFRTAHPALVQFLQFLLKKYVIVFHFAIKLCVQKDTVKAHQVSS